MADGRFQIKDMTALDVVTGLTWTQSAAPSVTGLPWEEALAFINDMNTRQDYGHTDWRLPNRRELNSLIDYGEMQPALPAGHPFHEVWKGWYWTSTTYAGATEYAWRVQFSGGRMFYGEKNEDSMVWPVRGKSETLLSTGQTRCFDSAGREINCSSTGQDGELKEGSPWPTPRFRENNSGIEDTLTGLIWHRQADLTKTPVNWDAAQAAVSDLALRTGDNWRMPTIRELESLTDCSRALPALPAKHPFLNVPEACWSSTLSGFDPAWAFCLYWRKGAVGVGFKANSEFQVWPVKKAQ